MEFLKFELFELLLEAKLPLNCKLVTSSNEKKLKKTQRKT